MGFLPFVIISEVAGTSHFSYHHFYWFPSLIVISHMPPQKTADLIVVDDNKFFDSAGTVPATDEEIDCEKSYGPYLKVMPTPYLSVKEDTHTKDVISQAKTIFDLPSVDYRDEGTPDDWIPRDGRLVRLTGRHPFNVEPPMHVLNQYKFITPTVVQYVRNHGACPRLTWEGHTVSIGGPLIPEKLELTMDQIAAMPPRE